MGSAFPVERQIACGLPDIPAVEGDLVTSCLLCEIIPFPKLDPFAFPIPVPHSADFGCYPIATTVDLAAGTPSFASSVTFDSPSETGYCKPRITFTVRIPSGGGGGCGSITVMTMSTADIALSGLQTINGYTLNSGEKILVTGQTNKVDNDVYIASSGSWDRLPHEEPCELVIIRFGSWKGIVYYLASEDPIQTGVTEKIYEMCH
jgi:hypothetical protein